jgi:hypothetical protein
VQDDRTVQVNDSGYAARPARIGSVVIVRIFERELEIRDMTTMALLRRHPLAFKKGEVLLPDAERIFDPSRQARQILRPATNISPNAHALCQRLFDKRGREAQKSMWGIVALVQRLPASIVEAGRDDRDRPPYQLLEGGTAHLPSSCSHDPRSAPASKHSRRVLRPQLSAQGSLNPICQCRGIRGTLQPILSSPL